MSTQLPEIVQAWKKPVKIP